jgi:hypothetical protein
MLYWYKEKFENKQKVFKSCDGTTWICIFIHNSNAIVRNVDVLRQFIANSIMDGLKKEERE